MTANDAGRHTCFDIKEATWRLNLCPFALYRCIRAFKSVEWWIKDSLCVQGKESDMKLRSYSALLDILTPAINLFFFFLLTSAVLSQELSAQVLKFKIKLASKGIADQTADNSVRVCCR